MEVCLPDLQELSEALGVNGTKATCECIGRHTPEGEAPKTNAGDPCNYAGYGLFRLSPLEVEFEDGKTQHCFAFAE